MNYPLISEYVEAVKSAEDNFKKLKYLRPVLDDDSCPVHSIGNFAVVFKMQDVKSGKFHAVRCFHREQAGRAENYRLIEEALSEVDSPYLVPFRYMENELSVVSSQTQDKIFPVTLMDWVDGMTLGKYLREHIANKHTLEMLVYRFSQLAIWLMQQPFAHGDLKPNNIIVRPDGSLALVDYDATFVPAMQGQQARELGSPDFCHPLRTKDEFNEHIDDFPIISILLSLKLIALHPEYLKEYGAADRLLFSAKDYNDITTCRLLKEFFPSADAELNKFVSLFMQCHSMKDLANVSFELLKIEKPIEVVLSTKVTKEDLANVWEDESGVYYSQDRKRLLMYPYLYKGNLESYVILDGTKVIGDSAFYNCFALKKILIPNSVISIGEHAFDDCSGLEDIVIPNSVTSIGDSAFNYCLSLKKIAIPNSVTSIGNNVFGHCSSLVEIIIPNSVISINNEAFGGCSSLKEIIIPESVIDIQGNPFTGCECHIICKSPHYVFENGILYTTKKDRIISCVTENEAIVIPYSIMTISNGAFSWRSSLKDVILPNSIIFIDDNAFCGCSNLKEITIPKLVTSIGNDAFCNCSFLTNITIPNSVISIGNNAFYGCSSLIEITIPNSVTLISDCVFSGCSSLKKIIVGDSVISIGSHAFAECRSLREITIPNSVTSIGNGAFRYCSSLERIVIPSSVKSIGMDVFEDCFSLKEIIILNSVMLIGERAFRGCFSLKKIIIPYNTKEKFEKLLPDYKGKLVEQ